MKSDGRGNIYVAYTIAGGHAKWVFTFQVGCDSFQSSTSACIVASVHKRDMPRLRNALMYLHPILSHIKGHVGHVQEVVSKVFLDQIPFVSATDNNVVDSMVRIDLQNVPENRAPADFHHWFGAQSRFFAQACSQPAC